MSAPAASPGAAEPALGFADVALAAPGRPLDASTRSYFEPRFGSDLSHVRVHSDDAGNRSAASIGARAYTHGADVFYAAGERPGPDRLTAHELAHVVQNASAAAPSVIRRTPGKKSRFKIVSRTWRVDGRDIVVIEIEGGARRAFYRRTGEGEKLGRAPPPNTWAPLAGVDPDPKARGEPRLNKDPYYKGFEADDALRGYGNETNKEVAEWLQEQKVMRGEQITWQEVCSELAQRLKTGKAAPLSATSPPARAVSGEIPGPGKPGPAGPAPSGPGPGSSGATKAEGTVGKLASEIGDLESSAAKSLGRGAKAARFGTFLLEMALPGPWDVLDLWISFFGSIAEAKEKLRSQYYTLGFAEGISASVLGFSAEEATRLLIKPVPRHGSVGEQVAGWSGVRESATNKGAVEGWNFAVGLSSQQRTALRKEGFATIKEKGHAIGPNFNFDDIVELAVALIPTVEHLFEVAREQERARQRAKDRERRLERGNVGNKI